MAAPAVPAPVFRSSVAMPRLGTWQPDTAAAVACAVAFVSIESIVGTSDASTLAVVVCATTAAAAVATRRRRPLLAAVAFTAALLLITAMNQSAVLGGAPANLLAWIPFDLAYGLGVELDTSAGLVGVLLLIIGLQATSSTFNPFFVMLTLGPWIGGRVLGSRRRIVARIEQRNRELVAEQVRYVRERVRLERARIALDLHDIVAHQMTLIAIQAAAAQRGNGSPATTSAALTCIVEAAGEARDEVGRLTRPAALPPVTIGQIDRLVRRARVSGLTVRYRSVDPAASISPIPVETAYRIVQEGLTNAIKHAPGAAVDIELRQRGDHVEVEVTTTTTPRPRSSLADSGGGFGLAGLGTRARSIGGGFAAGPTESGGWRISARLPCHPIPELGPGSGSTD